MCFKLKKMVMYVCTYKRQCHSPKNLSNFHFIRKECCITTPSSNISFFGKFSECPGAGELSKLRETLNKFMQTIKTSRILSPAIVTDSDFV